jgi:hypothetical protein
MSNRKTAFQVRLTYAERKLLDSIAHELKNTPSAIVRTMIAQSATRLGIDPTLQLGIATECSEVNLLAASKEKHV